MSLRVLVACEESQEVCKAFRKEGHEAYSCDLQPCSGGHPEWHIMGDVRPLINSTWLRWIQFNTQDGENHFVYNWDLIIAHPPCTYLSNVGNKYFSLEHNKPETVIKRWENRAYATAFFMMFLQSDCLHVCIENPVGFMSKAYRKPDQIIHPYQFAESEYDEENYHLKRTCLWLKNLPKLRTMADLEKPQPIAYCNGRPMYYHDTRPGTGQVRERLRSKTFPAIARAMANQWNENIRLYLQN